jgi:hypothetical protein
VDSSEYRKVIIVTNTLAGYGDHEEELMWRKWL